MLDRLRMWIASAFIYTCGIRFYASTTFPVGEDIQSFVVKSINGQKITFRFYREQFHFTQYIFNRLRHRSIVVYVVVANFDESAPDSIKLYSSTRICMNAESVFLISEEAIIKALLRAYVDFITVEFDRRKENLPVVIERRAT